ncbi:MAG: bifunctional phosphoribosylaminoimidazolecarboxamide formyltransferase/IMP cyclohydrolase [Bacteroidetes bacterium]|nr:bifunctional phosphoribosylaminoimidazolecarboxamide formyltransferase/IMP cyclohydrolase [Bacteroidota bacterium]
MTIEPLKLPAPNHVRPRRALLSVFDKKGLIPFAQGLQKYGIELVSSGGTAAHLRAAGLSVTDVADVTGAPPMLGGRVKTLHPVIHGGILARRDAEEDQKDLAMYGIRPIDLVVVNLYPFEQAVKRQDVNDAIAAENIDIGGPAMIRAAAKNFAYTTVVSSPHEYSVILSSLEGSDGHLPLDLRRRLAHRAFSMTAAYDQAITNYFDDDVEDDLPTQIHLKLPRTSVLRYGENPHQKAAFYGSQEQFFTQLHGKELSYNNLIDLDAALALIHEFSDEAPTIAILKHTNPCGVSSADTLVQAWNGAFATDTQSPFGGIVVMNRTCTLELAEAIDSIFLELIIAPSFDSNALESLKKKKNRRLILFKPSAINTYLLRNALGGLLYQSTDPRADEDSLTPVTDRIPTEKELLDLMFAWRIAKHVKSNAIVYAKDQQTIGIGAGQMSRIDASEIAVSKGTKSGLNFEGCVIASDAFFPFPDGLVAAADSGAIAAVQPGGSIRDQEVIDAANERGMAMVFTGKRHFRH